MLNNFSLYNTTEREYYYNSQFKPIKPKYRVNDKTFPLILTSKDLKNENAMLWLQYGIKVILRKLNYLKGNLDKTIPTSTFGALFLKFCQNSLTDEELNQLVLIAKYWSKNYLLLKIKNYLKELFYLERNEKLSDSLLQKMQILYDNYVDPNYNDKHGKLNYSIDLFLKETVFRINKTINKPKNMELYRDEEELTFNFIEFKFSIFEKHLQKEVKTSVKNMKIKGFSSIREDKIFKALTFRNEANIFFNLYLKENERGDLTLNVDLVS